MQGMNYSRLKEIMVLHCTIGGFANVQWTDYFSPELNQAGILILDFQPPEQ
jgi:hypothetical protein